MIPVEGESSPATPRSSGSSRARSARSSGARSATPFAAAAAAEYARDGAGFHRLRRVSFFAFAAYLVRRGYVARLVTPEPR